MICRNKMDVDSAIESALGFSSLKEKQVEAVKGFVNGKDVFPTGYGKSLIYCVRILLALATVLPFKSLLLSLFVALDISFKHKQHISTIFCNATRDCTYMYMGIWHLLEYVNYKWL